MTDAKPVRTRPLTIIAQDPSVRVNGRILTATVEVRAEALAAGPWGHRVQVIDYDASTHTLYAPRERDDIRAADGTFVDPASGISDEAMLNDPHFHAENVYAIVMRTLARFEQALGRRVSWGFQGHQLKIAPHAFADANAFYSSPDEALFFGYFPDKRNEIVFSCLSHDVVAHETTHALVDGLRHRFTDPSSPDQAAFHEGFADVVALLSVFALPEIAAALLDLRSSKAKRKYDADRKTVGRENLTSDSLKDSLLGLAEQMGEAMSQVRGQALRRSAELEPNKRILKSEEYAEPHRRGEVLVAAMMNAFVAVWTTRLKALGTIGKGRFDRERVVEEGAAAADYLLTMAIRALDYTPVVHVTFGDYLSALLTADVEIRPDDSKYDFRRHLRESFASYGIAPAAKGTEAEPGIWNLGHQRSLLYSRTHFEPMTRDADEVFWFIWENREALRVLDGAYGHVLSVRPCLRIAPDGFPLKETVVEFVQVLHITAGELGGLKMSKPAAMPDSTEIWLYGGNTLLFDEYGRLKYNIHNDIVDAKRQSERIAYLWERGYFASRADRFNRFSELHLQRALDSSYRNTEGESW